MPIFVLASRWPRISRTYIRIKGQYFWHAWYKNIQGLVRDFSRRLKLRWCTWIGRFWSCKERSSKERRGKGAPGLCGKNVERCLNFDLHRVACVVVRYLHCIAACLVLKLSYCTALYCVELCWVVLFCNRMYCIVSFLISSYCTLLFALPCVKCVVLCVMLYCQYGIALHCILSYRVVSCRVLSCRVVSCCIPSYCGIVLCCPKSTE